MKVFSKKVVAVLVTGTFVVAATFTGGSVASANSGKPIEMWVRSATSSQAQALVDNWNAIRKQQVKLTVIPNESFLQKVGIAAGAKQLPCIMASDVVYMPNFIDKGLYADITNNVNSWFFASKLHPGGLQKVDGKIYGVPHTIGMSAIFQNEILLKKAGIDPKKPLANLQELATNAAKVKALGGDTVGLYYTGGSGGSLAFTQFPFIWASGAEVATADGKKSLLDSEKSIAVFKIFNDMYKAGTVPTTVPLESGATRNPVFAKGNVGYMLASNATLQFVPDGPNMKVGVQGIPGLDGGQSTFIGGDSIGITSTCGSQQKDAWKFISWTLSSFAQVEIYAKINQLVMRSDLTNNKYAKLNPNVAKLNQLISKGKTPYSLNWGQTFNDPNGPALGAMQEALFGKGDPGAVLKKANDAITASLRGN